MSTPQWKRQSVFESSASVRLRADLNRVIDFCAEHGAHLESQSTNSWLVRSLPESRGVDSLLGCIEQQGDHFELMQLREGTFSWAIFDTLMLAVSHLLTPTMEALYEPIVAVDAALPHDSGRVS